MQSNKPLNCIIFLFIFLFYTGECVNGQIYTRIRNYYATDSSSFSGVVLESKGPILNAQNCYLKQGKGVKLLSPYDINEYGFDDGTKYFSREIKLQGGKAKRVFLEQLVKGDLCLYYYREEGLKTFFVEADGELLELPKKGLKGERNLYKNRLDPLIMDCMEVAGSTKMLNYNRNSLIRLVQSYNKCQPAPLLSLSYGFKAGPELISIFSLSGKGDDFPEGSGFITSPAYSVAVFVEKPVGKGNNSLMVEIGMVKFSMHRGWTLEQSGYEFIVDNTRLLLPVIYRHNLSPGTEGFFMEFGAAASYNLKLESKCYRSVYSSGVCIIEVVDENQLFATLQAGPLAGYGYEKNIAGFASIIAELRLGADFSFLSSGKHNSYLQLSCGLKF